MENELMITGSIRKYKFTTFISVLITLIFLLTNVYSSFNNIDIKQIYLEYGLHNASILEGEYYRLITGMFLHANIIHLICNVFSLLIFGSFIEKRIGMNRMIFLTLLSLVPIWIFNLVLSNGMYGIGISGYGCFLLTFVFTMYYKDMDKLTRKFLFQNILFIIVITLLIPFISISGHFSGLITGIILGYACRFITKDLMIPKENK